jgi:hypothetical protein
MAERMYSPFLRRWYFITKNVSSIGLKSGEYGGRNSTRIPLETTRSELCNDVLKGLTVAQLAQVLLDVYGCGSYP